MSDVVILGDPSGRPYERCSSDEHSRITIMSQNGNHPEQQQRHEDQRQRLTQKVIERPGIGDSVVVQMVAAGYDNDAITERMDMPMTTTVETLARAMDKLGAKDRHAAALKALRKGVILLEELHEL